MSQNSARDQYYFKGIKMFQTMKVFLSAVMFMTLLGCAGQQFKSIESDKLTLGVDHVSVIKNAYGKPVGEGLITKNGKQIKTLSYAYANALGESDSNGGTAGKGQTFYFHNGTLVGYDFISSYAEDSTDFDHSKIEKIKSGETTINEVTSLIGKAGGEYIYPLTKNESERAKIYLYNTVSGSFSLEVYVKQLLVYFNQFNVVTDLEFSETGSKL
jgi:hypothetical protein